MAVGVNGRDLTAPDHLVLLDEEGAQNLAIVLLEEIEIRALADVVRADEEARLARILDHLEVPVEREPEIPDLVAIGAQGDGAPGVGAPHVLLAEDVRGGPGVTREEEEQVVLEIVERVRRDLERPGLLLLVRQEPEAGDAAEGGDVLVLLADWLLEKVDLDPAGLLGQLVGMDQVLLERVECLQQGRREAAGGAQPGAGRHVGHAGDFQMRGADAGQSQGLADQRMLHLVDGRDPLHARVLEDQLLDERLVQRDVDVLVDGGGDDEPVVLAIVRRQIRPAAAQGDSEGTARDDHAEDPS